MNVNELKKLLKGSGSVLLMENGEPSMVVMSYRSFREMCSSRTEEREVRINHAGSQYAYFGRERETEVLDRLNKEIMALKNQIEAEERSVFNPHIGGID